MFSKACEYGIRATLYVVSRSDVDRRISLKEIAAEIDSPEAFTAKIMQQLVRHDIIQSVKGPNGGFFIDKASARSANLAQIVTAIDGDKIFSNCGLGLNECNALKPCPLHSQFVAVRESMQQMLEGTNLSSLAEELIAGKTVLKN